MAANIKACHIYLCMSTKRPTRSYWNCLEPELEAVDSN